MTKNPDWLKKGEAHVWHPYTQAKIAASPIEVISTNGCKIKLSDGTQLIDGTSSWWSACHGYNHPHIIAEMEKQLQQMPHVMFAGVAHEQAYKLASRLADLTGLDKVFFTDSGSTSVETALKMAVQYWHNKGDKRKNKFISFEYGYHGDTMGCMSLCDPDNGMHRAFNDYMPKQYCLRVPVDEYDFSEFETLVDGIKNTTAAVIIEPLVQGAGGMKFHAPDILAEIYRITKKYNLLFIADEIMTGFGRTGTMFACEEAAITPDIMCVGKGLTGGNITLAATLARQEIYDAFYADELEKALMSGPTFMASPLACAAANASLDLFETENRLAQVEHIEQCLYKALRPLKKNDKVRDVRIKGAIGVVQLKQASWEEMFRLRQKFVTKGVWLRPFSDVIYVMPPFTISDEDLEILTNAIIEIF